MRKLSVLKIIVLVLVQFGFQNLLADEAKKRGATDGPVWENVLSDYVGNTFRGEIETKSVPASKIVYSLWVESAYRMRYTVRTEWPGGNIDPEVHIVLMELKGNMNDGQVVLMGSGGETGSVWSIPLGLCDGYYCRISWGKGTPLSRNGRSGHRIFEEMWVFAQNEIVMTYKSVDVLTGSSDKISSSIAAELYAEPVAPIDIWDVNGSTPAVITTEVEVKESVRTESVTLRSTDEAKASKKK